MLWSVSTALLFGLFITHQACVTRLALLPASELSVHHLELRMG